MQACRSGESNIIYPDLALSADLSSVKESTTTGSRTEYQRGLLPPAGLQISRSDVNAVPVRCEQRPTVWFTTLANATRNHGHTTVANAIVVSDIAVIERESFEFQQHVGTSQAGAARILLRLPCDEKIEEAPEHLVKRRPLPDLSMTHRQSQYKSRLSSISPAAARPPDPTAWSACPHHQQSIPYDNDIMYDYLINSIWISNFSPLENDRRYPFSM